MSAVSQLVDVSRSYIIIDFNSTHHHCAIRTSSLFEGKSYDEDEENDYMEAFVKNVIHIDEHNREHRLGRRTFEMGLNSLADLVSIL